MTTNRIRPPKTKSTAKPQDPFKELLQLLHGIRLEPTHRRMPPKSLTGAAMTGNIELVKQFLAAGFDVNEKTVGSSSPLVPVIRRGDLAMVDLFLQHGCDPRKRPGPMSIFTPMYEAGETGNVPILQRLIKAGVNLKEEGKTALEAAAENGHVEAVQFLLKAGVSAPRKILDETIAAAAKDKGADPSAELASIRMGPAERPPLQGVDRENAIRRILEIIRSGAINNRLNERDSKGRYPLTLAAENGDIEVVQALLKAGANPNPETGPSFTPLHAACVDGHSAVASLLLKAGANVNAVTRLGATPLHQATEWGDPETIKLLLAAGADVTRKNAIGQTALNINAGLHQKTIQAMLKAARDKQHGKPTKSGSGLSCTEIKKVKSATARGTHDFKDFHAQPEWAIAIVRAPAEAVAKAYAKITKAPRWEADVAHKRIPAAKHGVFILQLKNNPWSLVLRSLGWIGSDEIKNLPREALQLSKQLKTRVYTYMAEDTSSCEGYELFENGQSLEKADWMGELHFTSKTGRKAPKFGEAFPDPLFANEGIYLPACWYEPDADATKLGLSGFGPEHVARLDYIALKV
ncbi:MAG: tankyrase-2-like isoform [Pedosphaera sp.]|nr:tankyrase-2-like isoform [Pedosphaera sp.]